LRIRQAGGNYQLAAGLQLLDQRRRNQAFFSVVSSSRILVKPALSSPSLLLWPRSRQRRYDVEGYVVIARSVDRPC
jgi:hypothetical protein